MWFLLEPTSITHFRRNILKYFLRLLIVAFSFSPFSVFAMNIEWSGNMALRYSLVAIDDKLPTRGDSGDVGNTKTETYQAKYFLLANGGWDNIEWGLGIAGKGSQTAPNSSFTTFRNGVNDFTPAIQEGWIRYGNEWGFGELILTAGKQKPAFRSNKSIQLYIDSDVRFDGLSEAWRWGSFGLNFAQYILGSNSRTSGVTTFGSSTKTNTEDNELGQANKANFAWLFTYQGTLDIDIADQIKLDLGVAWNQFKSYFSQTNELLNQGGTSFPVSPDLSQFHVYSDLHLPYLLGLQFEWVKARQQTFTNGVNADSTAIAAGLSYGKLKRVNDFRVQYNYRKVGVGAVHDHLAWNKMAPNSKGHVVNVDYYAIDRFMLSLLWLASKENEVRSAGGVNSVTSENNHISRIELTASIKF